MLAPGGLAAEALHVLRAVALHGAEQTCDTDCVLEFPTGADLFLEALPQTPSVFSHFDNVPNADGDVAALQLDADRTIGVFFE